VPVPGFSHSLKASCVHKGLFCDSQPGLYLGDRTIIHQLRPISKILNTLLNHTCLSPLRLCFGFDYIFPWLGDACSRSISNPHQDLSIPVCLGRTTASLEDLVWRVGIARIPAANGVTTCFISSRIYRRGERTSKQRGFFLTISLYK
jgi:hypothetical protein